MAAELRSLLSRPLAPLSNLDKRERRSITDARLRNLRAALDQIRPTWIPTYAVAAVMALPTRERRLREFMLRELFRSHGNAHQALTGLAKALQEQPERQRATILPALLRGLSTLSETPRPGAFEETRQSLMALVSAAPAPASPKAFAQLALEVARAAEALSPGHAAITAEEAQSPIEAVSARLDPSHRAFLLRPRWGAFAPAIASALWDQLWRQWRGTAPADAARPTQQSLLKEAAWSEADQAIARALQDSGRLNRSLDRLDAVAEGEASARAASARGASGLVLQWVRQAARLRNMECHGTFGDVTAFDPAFHDSHEAMPGERVRIVKPPVVRSNGSQQAVVLRGEVELE